MYEYINVEEVPEKAREKAILHNGYIDILNKDIEKLKELDKEYGVNSFYDAHIKLSEEKLALYKEAYSRLYLPHKEILRRRNELLDEIFIAKEEQKRQQKNASLLQEEEEMER